MHAVVHFRASPTQTRAGNNQMAEESSHHQTVGEVYENGLIYSLSFRKVHCDVDETKDSRLVWTTQIERTVQYGTVPALIEHLAPTSDDVSYFYRQCFLAVYRTFVTPDKLLHSLVERYVTVDTSLTDNYQNKLNILKSLLSFVKLWLDKYSTDFLETPTLLTTIEEFLTTKTHPLLSELLTELNSTVSILKDTSFTTTTTTTDVDDSYHLNISESAYSWFDKAPVQVAKDLTAYDAEIFRSVIPHHCLNYIRRSSSNNNNTVLRAINTFNNVTKQVILTILHATNSKGLKTPSSRGKRISHWIDIAVFCRTLKNFSSLLAIVSGLHSSSVHRLEKSWSYVHSDKKSTLKELDQLLSCDSNFQAFRDVLDKEATGKGMHLNKQSTEALHVHGVVPYLGTLLTDLTMLHTAIPDTNKEGMINFDKRRKEYEILSKLSLFQTTAGKYNFTIDTSLIHWLHNASALSDKESFELSTELETPITTISMTPKSSPSHSMTSPPPSQILLRKSLQLITVAVQDESLLNPPDPYYNSYHDNSAPPTPLITISKEDGQCSPIQITRSNSSRDIRDSMIVKVSSNDKGDSTNYCNYKSILINKSDHTDSVIDKVLEKFDLPGSSNSYQIYQRLTNTTRGGDILIPHQAVVYYALVINHKETPILILKVKK